MKDNLAQKRVFFIGGHAQCGKTSLAEAILFKSGAVSRLGKVEEGTTVSDYEEDEKERKSSINLAFLQSEYKNNLLQFVDTPGYLDFIGEVISASRAADFAVIVVDPQSSIGVGTEKIWELIQRQNMPCVFFINKMDKDSGDFNKVVQDIRQQLTKKAVALTLINEGKPANIILDEQKRQKLGSLAEEGYTKVCEAVAESDDALLEKYLETGVLDPADLERVLKTAVAEGKFFPILAGSALTGEGVEDLLEIIAQVMPSSQEREIKWGVKDKEGKAVSLKIKADSPFCAQVIKTMIDPYVGQLTIFKVLGGKISTNSTVLNTTKGGKEKIGQLYFLQGKQQIARETVYAGEIAAVAKLKGTSTSDTLCEEKSFVVFDPLEFPPPAYSASVKPKTRQDEDKISAALAKLTSEDPTFKVARDAQTKELVISGMGELHLHIIIERMKKKYGVDVELGTPKVPYKETILKTAKAQGKYKKQTGGRGQYGDVWLEISPLERGGGFKFVDKIVGGAIPRNFIPSVEKGIRKSLKEGFLAGYELVDMQVTVYDGSYHPVDSSDIAFQIAASMALKKALEQAQAVLLEPVMNVEIIIPDEFMGQVNSDISGRRGRVLGMEAKGKNQIVKAQIPLAEMFKYASDLRSFTGGRGSYTMSFSHYEVVPARLAQGVIAQASQAKQEE